MAKVSPETTKYMIYASFEAQGRAEKPDVVGALFGQTEGLLGKDLELRELQKEGKVGRIEVKVENSGGNTTGEIKIPSSLNKSETTLIAAAVETIEKVGPTESKVRVEKIEDVRKNKRDFILKRAGELLGNIEEKMPGSKEIASDLQKKSREDKLHKYGDEDLAAGDLEGDKIIIVEGRADVVNLLGNNFDNVIGMDGTKLPESVKELSKDKEATLFVDGDRGGKLIAKNVIENANIDYITFAPDGKEVEELTYKEIHNALEKKETAEKFMKGKSKNKSSKSRKNKSKNSNKKNDKKKVDIKKKEKELKEMLKSVEGSKCVLLLSNDLSEVGKASTKGKILSELKNSKENIYCLVADRASKGVIDAAEKFDVDHIVANNFAFSSEKANMVSL